MFSLWSTPAVFSFSDSIPTEITENVFTVTESILRNKIFATSLYLSEIVLFWGTKRAILNGQYRSILPARVPNQNSEFAASSPVAELGSLLIILMIILGHKYVLGPTQTLNFFLVEHGVP